MMPYVVPFAFGVLCISMTLCAWRLAFGPTAVDRVLALDTLYINFTALIVVYGLHLGRDEFFESALLIALLGFIGTVAFAKFLLRGRIIE